jgi:predicted nucleic acid-binding protein
MNKIADLFIGTYCIEHGHALLQCDADFQPMARLCGLQLLPPAQNHPTPAPPPD